MLCFALCLLCLDVEKRKSAVCGFVTPLEGSEADAHRKPEVSHLCCVGELIFHQSASH